MARAFSKEIRRSIAGSIGRFAAIAIISFLGAGFYGGLRMAAPDMRIAGDDFFDAGNLYDIAVTTTLGIDDETLDMLRDTEGVEAVTATKRADAMAAMGDGNHSVRVESLDLTAARASDTSDGMRALSDDAHYVNRPLLLEGSWPASADECVACADAARKFGVHVGDVITLEKGTEDLDDVFVHTKFRVSGLVNSAAYISKAVYSPTTVGTGDIEMYVYVGEDAFEEDRPHTMAYATISGARDLRWTSAAYDDAVDAVRARIDDVAPALGNARWRAVVGDAQAELDDARTEFDDKKADALKELADGERELADSRAKLDDAAYEIVRGKADLDDAAAKLVDGRNELEKGEAEYADGVAELAKQRQDAEKKIADGQAQIDKEKASAFAKLDKAQADLDAQKADAEAQLADGQAQIDANRAAAEAGFADGQAQIDEQRAAAEAGFADGQAQIDANRSAAEAQFAEGQAQIDEQRAELAPGLAQLDTLRAQLEALKQLPDPPADQIAYLEATIAKIEAGAKAIEQAQAELDAQKAAAYAQLDAAQAELDAQKAAAYAQLDAAQAELDAQKAAALAQLDEAQKQLDSQRAEAEKGFADGQAQIDANRKTAEDGFAEAQAELDKSKADAEAAFADAQTQLDEARAKLDDGWAQSRDGMRKYIDGLAEWERGRVEYLDGEAKYADGMAEFIEGRDKAYAELDDAERELADAQQDIDDIERPEVFVMDRSKNAGAVQLESDADGIRQIATFIPFMFFLVAALVCLTSMTRMVDEERLEIGTHKALGYSKARITSKYLIYAVLASGLGSVLGVVALGKALPFFIMTAYQIAYANPFVPLPLDPEVSAKAIGLSVGVCAVATIWAALASLRARPAVLMLPRVPKAGKRIILERIKPLWSRMSFSQKVTARNLLRYKKRFFMAVVGIAGCTALLMIGFGLRDAIGGIVQNQYENLILYDMVVRVDDDIEKDQVDKVVGVLEGEEGVEHLAVHEEAFIAHVEGADDLRVQLVVPQDTTRLDDFVTLRDRVTQEPIRLGDGAMALTEKTATMLTAHVGGTVSLFELNDIGDAKGAGIDFTVGGIAENYLGHYAYLLPEDFERAMGEKCTFSTYYVIVPDEEAGARLEEALHACEGVNTVSFIADKVSLYEDMLDVMNKLIFLVVAAAAALAFVVLYNLTNINIGERIREIATLKVLGFTRREEHGYIFREVFVMSIIGALIGCVLGVPLTTYIAEAAETPQMMFGRSIEPWSFAIAFALTLVFTVLVAFTMRGKLARISMVESLKSVE